MFNRRKENREGQKAVSACYCLENGASGEGESGKDLAVARESHLGASGEVNAYFGKGSKFSGKLCFEGIVRVDGKVEGEIQSSDTLIIGEGAEVRANINVTNVFISGRVDGDIIANGRIELARAGSLNGNIRTPVFIIQEGGSFNGRCTMSTTGIREQRSTEQVLPEELSAEEGPAATA